ncbi:MAG TPA: TIGR03790 family protein [Steroidobacteraceae bacterium]
MSSLWHIAGADVGQNAAAAIPLDRALTAKDLGVIVNEADPLSIAIGDYYRRKRDIPEANIVRVRFDATHTTLSAAQFAALRADIGARTAHNIQAYALTWVRPYRVECMSITTALAAGFDTAYCSERCTSTRWSPYYNSNSYRPYDDFGLRPAMSIAALDLPHARELIDRGVASDHSRAQGTAYLVATNDTRRNVRAAGYADARLSAGTFPVEIVTAPALESRQDVMFYFIGAVDVTDLATNKFLPGAVADHLTSFGGDLLGNSQMSSLRWLEAGATGSYGTVTEPCNITAKFPSPGLVMKRYLAGETLIEAYWKSVAMPGQGIFIGEPLARPYGSNAVPR